MCVVQVEFELSPDISDEEGARLLGEDFGNASMDRKSSRFVRVCVCMALWLCAFVCARRNVCTRYARF